MQPNQSEITPPSVPAGPAWDDAFLRVESYLRAHHLGSRLLLNQITSDIIGEAHELARANPREEPVALAMQVTHARIGAWFARVGEVGDWSDKRVRAAHRLALVLADVPARWPASFLSDGPVPPELVSALAAVTLRPGPELRFSKMSAAPLEFSFDRPDNHNGPRQARWRGFRGAAGWLVVVGVYGAVWAASH